MLTAILLCCAPLLSPLGQEGGDDPAPTPAPTPEQIQATCSALQKAFGPRAGGAERLAKAMKQALECVHPDVIAVIESVGLRSEVAEARIASVEMLGRMDHEDALKALHALLEHDEKEIQGNPSWHAEVLRAIARHGKEQSIPLLVANPFQSPDRGVLTARFLGLGHIRSTTSVAELIRLMRSGPRPLVAEHMEEFRLALLVLTGEDKGIDPELWISWYGEHEKGLEVAAEPGTLPPELERRWVTYWGEVDRDKRKRRRPPVPGNEGNGRDH